jgi:hypothetical protein
MTPANIFAAVEAAYSDWSGGAVPHLTDLVPLAITRGIEEDADMVFLATIIDDRVHCGLVCGCTLLVGASMRWAITRYAGDDRLLETFKTEAAALVASDHLLTPVRGADERWRSFRGEKLLSFNERLARIRRELN